MTSPERAQQEYNSYQRRCGRIWPVMASGLWFVLAAGCSPQAGIMLMQPSLTGSQHELDLTSNESHWAEGKQAGRILVEFPLPGATTGKATYLLYLRLPPMTDSGKKNSEIIPCGFFIQVRGEYAGLAGVTGGTMRVLRRDHNACKLAVDLTCDDGSRIQGEVLAKRNEAKVKGFERENRAADVDKLIAHCAAQSAPSG